MILYIEAPDVKEKEGKYFTLGYLLPRSTRKIFVESIPPVNSPAISQTEAPKVSRFRLKIEIVQEEDWTNNYKDSQYIEETIEFEVGKQRTFSEGSKVGNVLAAASLGASLGAGVGAVGSPVGAAIGGAVGGVLGAAGGALLPK